MSELSRSKARLILRRSSLTAKGVVIATLAFFLTAGTAWAQVAEQPIPGDPVRTTNGLVSGKLLPDGVKAYLGLRYAEPPVGDRRWKAPQPLVAWRGVYHADRIMPACIQALRPHNINHYFGEEATSEDCLFMNIWASGTVHPGDKLPVVVFIYGGAFTVGSSGMPLYGGENVARAGAIFVNFNYRIGLLGFMASPELTAESPNHSSGNYGILDQIAALRWIHQNISAFGGDPAKVIIAGQSAGATSVSILQASPLAKGLFRGVVAMSGGVWAQGADPKLPMLAVAEKTGPEAAKLLNVRGIAALRQVPADQILALQEQFQLGRSHKGIRVGGPNVDGYLLPAQPVELFAEHKASYVPAILGYTRDEAKGFGQNALTEVQTVSQLNAAVSQLYGPEADEFHKLYPASTNAQARTVAGDALRNAFFSEQSAWWWANEQNKLGLPVFVYEFSHVQPFNPAVTIADHPERIGAFHTSDVPYWFNTLGSLNMFRPTRLWKPDDRALARTMVSMLISFAKTGNPTAADASVAPTWPAFSRSEPDALEIGNGSSTAFSVKLMHAGRLEFQAAHPPKFLRRQPSEGPKAPKKPFSKTRD